MIRALARFVASVIVVVVGVVALIWRALSPRQKTAGVSSLDFDRLKEREGKR
ncbi:hypothetical protein [Fundidesulfovibrio putealis]|uniref:hypothetical protein n=1 Tax=Fundidesulfovibrio putealis TaxID=270496 RepID=UPI000416BD56|nr:hypothetical protein [Fundidesulfovibrio putealis]